MGKLSISIGDVIGARYCIEAVLGQGGMAIVYQARNTGTGKASALKIVHPHLVTRPELVEMFVREAQVAGRIGESPYVVNVFDAGVDERLGVPFMAMELLKGETLDHYVETRGPMPRTMVRTLFEQLADALDQAHRAGVIHRDLKPSNLFITNDRRGRPILKIMDFGIAKVLQHSPQRTATRIGSPAYAAPEQQASAAFRKLAAKHGVKIAQGVSPATDVWALGLVAYELLTGLPKGQYWATLESLDDILIKVAMEDNEPATQRAGDRASLLPPGFDEWFARCMRKDAAERWQTPGEAVAVLRRLLAPTELEIDSTQPLSDLSPRIQGGGPTPDPSLIPDFRPSRFSRSAPELAGPDSDTQPDSPGAPPDLFTPTLYPRPSSPSGSPISHLGPPSSSKPDAGPLQTRSTWTRTNTWPRRSKVALVVGSSTFAIVALVFLFRSPPPPPKGRDVAQAGAVPAVLSSALGTTASIIPTQAAEPPARQVTKGTPAVPASVPAEPAVASPSLGPTASASAAPRKVKKPSGPATPSIPGAVRQVRENVKKARARPSATAQPDAGAPDSDAGAPFSVPFDPYPLEPFPINE